MDNLEKTRFVKVVVFSSVNDVNKFELTINETVDIIRKNGGKVISIIPHVYGVSPMKMVYDIIYEHYEPLAPELFKKGGKPSEKQ